MEDRLGWLPPPNSFSAMPAELHLADVRSAGAACAHDGSPAAVDRPKLNGGSQSVPRVQPARLTDCSGRVLPATALACAAAVERIAGIEYPVAVDSVRLGNAGRPGRLSPTVATTGSTPGERRR